MSDQIQYGDAKWTPDSQSLRGKEKELRRKTKMEARIKKKH